MKVFLVILEVFFLYSCVDAGGKKIETTKTTELSKGQKEDKAYKKDFKSFLDKRKEPLRDKEKDIEDLKLLIDKGIKLTIDEDGKLLDEIFAYLDPELLSKAFLAYYNKENDYIKNFIINNLDAGLNQVLVAQAFNLFINHLKKDPNNEDFISRLYGKFVDEKIPDTQGVTAKLFLHSGSKSGIYFAPETKIWTAKHEIPKAVRGNDQPIYFIEYILYLILGEAERKYNELIKSAFDYEIKEMLKNDFYNHVKVGLEFYLKYIIKEYFANDKNKLKNYFEKDSLGQTLLKYLKSKGFSQEKALEALGGVWSL